MGKIDTSVRKTLHEMEGHARKSIASGIVSSWNQYQVVSVDKWDNIKKKKPRLDRLLKYIPDQYMEDALEYYQKTEEEKQQIDKWHSDWIQFLQERKDSKLGKRYCSKCFLHPDAEGIDKNIHNIILKGIDAKFPCDVVNYFQCPFENNNELFYLKNMMDYTGEAISHSEGVADRMEQTHYAYPSRSFAEDYHDLHNSGKPNGWGSDSFVGDEESTKVPIREISDKFKVLTDKKLLGIILEEYVTHLRKGTAYGSVKYTKEKAEKVNSMIPDILRYFLSIKSKITINDVQDRAGRNLAEEKMEKKRIADLHERRAREDVNIRQNRLKPRNGTCMTCKEFANILCVECDKWICGIHYNDHKVKIHKIRKS